jgi:hypothetical protein
VENGETKTPGPSLGTDTKPSVDAEKDGPSDAADKTPASPTRHASDNDRHSSVAGGGRTDAGKSGSRSRLSRFVEMLTVVIALAAFLLSVYNLVEAHKKPELSVTMPKHVRLTHFSDGDFLIIQPTFAVLEDSNLTSVVSAVRLEVEPNGNVSPQFRWTDIVRFVDKNDSHIPDWEYVNDPVPIIVTPDGPKSYHLRFDTLELPAGTWTMRLIAERVGDEPLQRSFCITLTPGDVESMKKNSGSYHNFTNDLRHGEPKGGSAGRCYTAIR